MTHEEIKELITLSAQALGYEHTEVINGEVMFTNNGGGLTIFNPLTSLSDRAKMCDELEIDIDWDYRNKMVSARSYKGAGTWKFEPYGSDKSLACSLACLKVAAAVSNFNRLVMAREVPRR